MVEILATNLFAFRVFLVGRFLEHTFRFKYDEIVVVICGMKTVFAQNAYENAI